MQTKYGEIRNISPYLVRMRENTDEKNSKYGYFLRSQSKLKQSNSQLHEMLKLRF